MKTLMATAAAISLLAGISVATAENAPASRTKANATIEQSTAPKVNASKVKTSKMKASIRSAKVHNAMRMKHRTRDTTGSGGRVGTIGSGRNDPSIHQSAGDRDSRDYPKQH